MKRKKAKFSELRSLENIIQKHERDRAFKPLLDQARVQVALARQTKLAKTRSKLRRTFESS
jgi:hypothetical protein